MKKIKIILSVISVFVFAFLATGIVIKETSYAAEVSIDKPIKMVFSEFNKHENFKSWIPEIKSYEVVNENFGKTGSVYNIIVENQNQEIKMIQRILAYVPNEKVTFYFDAENMLKKDDYVFTEKNGITTISLNSSCNSKTYIMSCMLPYFKGKLERQSQVYLDNFKEFLEAQKPLENRF
ncbi:MULTISPECIES: SRPBCC family protein [unclassified Polaribacter]|uniref:SRPBCC family protein n=1 Tax=unclassified Polaribacter TaxID=196858 RepID=UPI0011BE55BD|nr:MULTISPECIES: SRPBCC family protein [unclassified Polaribacter]TXD51318.1 SRPBCC family protein [Polaribacter sp. IC063]TXD57037.1 SRPBCC family protein [Polaribacter sp. IC066]